MSYFVTNIYLLLQYVNEAREYFRIEILEFEKQRGSSSERVRKMNIEEYEKTASKAKKEATANAVTP